MAFPGALLQGWPATKAGKNVLGVLGNPFMINKWFQVGNAPNVFTVS